ncbi:MAG TPA: hypothetical protein DEB40_14530 [Elusimicrobia bacterium]|nr:hypothetical protein [Elusimicrobiota bacterium]HBT62950.1 hypothetical protein [Elusimicrobiota bacterium]
MTAPKDPPEREVRVVLDLGCYDREAITQAAAVFSPQAEFFIEKEGKETLEVSVSARGDAPGEARRLAGEFLNEALNQDLRLRLARSNQGLLRLLAAQALRSAAGAERPPLDAKAQRRLRLEARRLMAGIPKKRGNRR